VLHIAPITSLVDSVRAASCKNIAEEVTMEKREHFVTHVTCPECALNGTATWEEDEKGNLETTVKTLSPGFLVDPDSEIRCAECGVKARVGQTLSRSEKGPVTPKLGHDQKL